MSRFDAVTRCAAIPCRFVGCCFLGLVWTTGVFAQGDAPAASPKDTPAATSAAGSSVAPEARAAVQRPRVVVKTTDGGHVEGDLLKRDDADYYIYVGGSVLRIDQRKVKEVETSERGDEGPGNVRSFRLYRTADRPVRGVQALVEELGPAIVVVKTPAGLGTGWLINKEGHLVTNNHVVEGEHSITVTMFRRGAEGFGTRVFKKVRIVALSPNMDLALLKVEEPIDVEFPQLYIGDSTQLKVGDRAFAIGNPMGLERSTSEGIISKVARNMEGRLYIQTTAPIAPGNSGGPLFNERGEVVGVVNMGYIMLDGLGFAIPSKYVVEFLNNVEAFAYDEDNPNTGVQYMETPVASIDGTVAFGRSDFLKTGPGVSHLTLADLDGDGVQEVVFANNNKAEVGIIRRRGKDKDAEKAPAASGATDFDDINQLRDSERFKIDTIAVRSAIGALDVADLNGDGRRDIVFYGDIDKLSVMEQAVDGSFGRARRIDDVQARGRRGSVRVVDIDGSGRADIVVLGTEILAVLRDGGRREEYPLGSRYQANIKHMEIVDADEDGRLDVVFFIVDPYYAAVVRLQNGEGRFVEEHPVRSTLTGPVARFRRGAGLKFLTLDSGLNRVREVSLSHEDAPSAGGLPDQLVGLVVDPRSGMTADLELTDIGSDGTLELVGADRNRNEYVVYHWSGKGFLPRRSPALTKVAAVKVFTDAEGKAAVFSLSTADKVFGVSRVENGRVLYPRPISTEGEVEDLMVQELDGAAAVVWVEKVGSAHHARHAPAAELAARAYDGGKGSIEVKPRSLTFKGGGAALPRKPARLAWADFNGDSRLDLVVFWSYSGKESLYLGTESGEYREIIGDRNVLEEKKTEPLVVEDLDGDGVRDVLLVQPGFVRVLRVDARDQLYVDAQYNWPFGAADRLVLYEGGKERPTFITVEGQQARLVALDKPNGAFTFLDQLDLSGLEVERLKVGDVDGDGKRDLLVLGEGVANLFVHRPRRWVAGDRTVFNARLDHFTYWNLHAGDLDGDGADEVLLFDSTKAMFEVYRPDAHGDLKSVLRRRLFEKTISEREEESKTEIPQEIAIGDVDGDSRQDFVCALHDRVAIYQQAPAGAE